MFTIRKLFKVEYAHQLDSAFSSLCSENIHGHQGVIEVFFQSGYLNNDGMVIDFGLVKEKIKDYIMSFDHALIVSEKLISKHPGLKKHNKKLKIVNYNPTAEAMSYDIYQNIIKLMPNTLSSSLWLQKVRFHETDTGYAEYSEK